jgi:hypothetical protein
MLLKNSEIESETVVSRSGAGKRALAVIACVSILAGCESVPEVPSFSEMGEGISNTYSKVEAGIRQQYKETFNSPDEPPDSETVSSEGDDYLVKLSRADVRRLQTRLAKLGYRSGPVDGVLGSKTTSAIKRYQREHDLPVTGKVSSNFLAHVEAKSAGGSGEQILTNSPY